MKSTTTRAVHMFKAKTDDRQTTYKVERTKDGKTWCTCKGFMFRQTCRHAEQAKTWK